MTNGATWEVRAEGFGSTRGSPKSVRSCAPCTQRRELHRVKAPLGWRCTRAMSQGAYGPQGPCEAPARGRSLRQGETLTKRPGKGAG